MENLLDLLFFEDLTLGSVWTTRRRTVLESDLSAYAGLSGDFGPLHVDREHARASHFGGQVVPGALLVALAMGLGSMDVPLARTVALVGTTWRFERPVRPGDTVRCHWRLNRKRAVEEPAWGLCGFAVEMENQRSEVVASGEVVRLLERRPLMGTEPAPVVAGQPETEVARTGRRRRRRRSANGDTPSQQPLVAAEVLAAQPSAEAQPFVESLATLEATTEGGTAAGQIPRRTEPAPAATDALAAAQEQGDGGAAPARRRRRRGGRGRGGREPVGPEVLALQAVDEEAPTPGAAIAAMAGAQSSQSQSAGTAATAQVGGEQEAARPQPSSTTPPAAFAATPESAAAVATSLPPAATPFSQELTELDPNRFAPLNAPSPQSPPASGRPDAAVAPANGPAPRPRRPRGPRRAAGGSTVTPEAPAPPGSNEGSAPAGSQSGDFSGSSVEPTAPARTRRPGGSQPPPPAATANAGESAASGVGASEAHSSGGS
ncbi:MAG: MaoC family dehydratase N-terminal domain-containing protein [Candidatus Dormibacteraeota bacterium]|uniref:MaoC family dehydratase N-terminal domain-containing protein n=1 Tax=Candidatus Dormiibacter inghamiae TaxID=3127013 RepID=A0A934KH68_9BACT|nr:MaoC family dehydratase N-terminal domain-containing protein [Candidatus Dormibacteraeota bacterium]MBJ7605646.1 MaoC family dehydratase N-terminal domain-containing protein [Candidatus Dormibacteraeota bacterium]